MIGLKGSGEKINETLDEVKIMTKSVNEIIGENQYKLAQIMSNTSSVIAKINDKLVRILDSSKNINVFRGDDLDVLSRYSEVAKKTKANIIIRLTGDCPLIDSEIVDNTVKLLIAKKADYASNIIKRTSQ